MHAGNTQKIRDLEVAQLGPRGLLSDFIPFIPCKGSSPRRRGTLDWCLVGARLLHGGQLRQRLDAAHVVLVGHLQADAYIDVGHALVHHLVPGAQQREGGRVRRREVAVGGELVLFGQLERVARDARGLVHCHARLLLGMEKAHRLRWTVYGRA